MLPIRVADADVILHPSGAALLPAQRVLLVADAHFGKAVSFRRQGVPVPAGTTTETLRTLSGVIAQMQPKRLAFLGDFLHSRPARGASTMAALREWRERHGPLEITLVRGNHDRRAGDPPSDLGLAIVDEPLPVGPFALCHHPRPVPGRYVLAGHWHPCVTVGGRAFERLRLPCFWFGDDSGAQPQRAVGVLPAFGSFTGMHPIEPAAGDRIYAIADDVVRALPVA